MSFISKTFGGLNKPYYFRHLFFGLIIFIASIGRKQYQCYITTVAGVISSDAICAGTDGTKSKRSCNALEKDAGHC